MDLRREIPRLILNTLKSTFIFLRFVMPWVFRAAWLTVLVMGGTARSIYSGLRPQIDQIAAKIMNDAANFVPINFHGVLKWFSYAAAYLTVVFGWICLAYLTVWICGRLLRLL
jgi:hypothetical protein